MSRLLMPIAWSFVLVFVGCGSATSDLKPDQVKEVVSSNKMSMQECYEKSLEQKEVPPKKTLEIDVKLMVEADGRVVEVFVRGAARYPDLKKCLKRTIKNWNFPESRSKAPVFFPIVFNPR